MAYGSANIGSTLSGAKLRRGDELVGVEPQVFALLVYLVQHRPRRRYSAFSKS
jgi:DNA-binding winged helix-turn-helix (wHTH) protein